MSPKVRVLIGALKVAILVAIWFLLRSVAVSDVEPTLRLAFLVVPLLLVPPVSLAGRSLLSRHPGWVTPVTAGVDLVLIVLFGTAVVEGVHAGTDHPGAPLPLPPWPGLGLMWVSGVLLALTVLNLAIRGLGAPFAAPISRRLATDLLYRYTRNPMVLALLLFLLAIGLWLRSAWFIAWVALLVAPVWVSYLKLFEEKELELRFGPSYVEYRDRTPLLWPGRSRPAPGR